MWDGIPPWCLNNLNFIAMKAFKFMVLLMLGILIVQNSLILQKFSSEETTEVETSQKDTNKSDKKVLYTGFEVEK